MKPSPVPTAAQRRKFKRRLLTWFRRHGRDLPWRRTRDPYRILVAEIMLQQTQVSRVERYWPRFLGAYPTIHHLARATPARVRESWSGLGYYRRAGNLHQLARDVVTNHGGELPPDAVTLRSLPGVGTYTAGAVASFAFELAEPAIDTNVARVLRRVFHPEIVKGRAGERVLHATAKALVPRRGRNAWITNQALMELGALVCTARVMRCGACPVRSTCQTALATLPARASTASVKGARNQRDQPEDSRHRTGCN
ncbi:MAG: A/G-specific adenine glycosylase [Gemmatimonadales bacterium]